MQHLKTILTQSLQEGLQKFDDDFVFDWVNDDPVNDIITLKHPELRVSNIAQHVFLYQYEFTTNASSEVRTKFFNAFRFSKLHTTDMQRFLNYAVANLQSAIDMGKISCILFPKSRSTVNVDVVKKIHRMYRLNVETFELVKAASSDVKFDLQSFKNDVLNATHTVGSSTRPRYTDKQCEEALQHIDKMLQQVKTADYFSIASDFIKNKYKQYFVDFLKFSSEEEESAFKKIATGNILIVDDVTTTGSTILEMIRIVHSVNPQARIYVFSIIGKNIT